MTASCVSWSLRRKSTFFFFVLRVYSFTFSAKKLCFQQYKQKISSSFGCCREFNVFVLTQCSVKEECFEFYKLVKLTAFGGCDCSGVI